MVGARPSSGREESIPEWMKRLKGEKENMASKLFNDILMNLSHKVVRAVKKKIN
jgi:hypothetical protein